MLGGGVDRTPVIPGFGLPGGGCVREWRKESDAACGEIYVEHAEALQVQDSLLDDAGSPGLRRNLEEVAEREVVGREGREHGGADVDGVVKAPIQRAEPGCRAGCT